MKTIKDFYDFASKFLTTTFQAHPINLKMLNVMENLLKGELCEKIDFPVIFKQDSGKKIHDILDTGSVCLLLISEKMKDVLEQNNLTGWKTFPVQVFDKKGNEIKRYYGFSVIGKCGPIDYTKCEIVEKRLVPTGPISKFFKGRYIGLETWDGSDFFSTLRLFLATNLLNRQS